MVGRPWRRPHPAATASSQASPKSPCRVFWSSSRTRLIVPHRLADCGELDTLGCGHRAMPTPVGMASGVDIWQLHADADRDAVARIVVGAGRNRSS